MTSRTKKVFKENDNISLKIIKGICSALRLPINECQTIGSNLLSDVDIQITDFTLYPGEFKTWIGGRFVRENNTLYIHISLLDGFTRHKTALKLLFNDFIIKNPNCVLKPTIVESEGKYSIRFLAEFKNVKIHSIRKISKNTIYDFFYSKSQKATDELLENINSILRRKK